MCYNQKNSLLLSELLKTKGAILIPDLEFMYDDTIIVYEDDVIHNIITAPVMDSFGEVYGAALVYTKEKGIIFGNLDKEILNHLCRYFCIGLRHMKRETIIFEGFTVRELKKKVFESNH